MKEGRKDEHAEGRTKVWKEGRKNGWKYGRMEVRKDGRKEGRKEGRANLHHTIIVDFFSRTSDPCWCCYRREGKGGGGKKVKQERK